MCILTISHYEFKLYVQTYLYKHKKSKSDTSLCVIMLNILYVEKTPTNY